MLAFPYGKNDDVLDALAMQLEMWALLRKEMPKTVVNEPVVGSLDYALQQVKRNRDRTARRTRMMGLVSMGAPVGKIVYRNRRMVVK